MNGLKIVQLKYNPNDILVMSWIDEMHVDFAEEFLRCSENVQDILLAEVEMLEKFSPQLKRPHADTLVGSKHRNMKELKFKADDGVWRVAFAFDPDRKAILLIAGISRV